MDPSKLRIPHLSNAEIRNKAEDFRREYIGNEDCPINIEWIVEAKLGLNIVPIQGIEEECNMFALLQSDLRTILVEHSNYLDDRYEKKYRFDITHEVGHWYLHRDTYEQISFPTPREWADFIQNIPGKTWSSFEYQAYEFAGRLLVPKQALLNEVRPFKDEVQSVIDEYNTIGVEEIIPYVANKIPEKFGVSAEVLSRRIRNEKIIDAILN